MSQIHETQDSHVSLITLNAPDNGNRLNSEILRSLMSAFTAGRNHADTRIILLRSRGPAFCLGMDLSGWDDESGGPAQAEEAIRLYSTLLWDMFTCPKPVLCLVNGQVKAGGMGLVCASDIVLATRSSTFEMGEVLFGLIPANVLPYLIGLRVPIQKARYLILTAKRLEAEEAHRLGLVDEVFETGKLEKGVRLIIRQLLRASPEALAETKDFTRALLEETISRKRERAREKIFDLMCHPRFPRAVAAFEAGELPEWSLRYRPETAVNEGELAP